ncbi:unnamed protein product [Lactuca virosa]|uniref:Uncharacterized protein n=1 Tax=Lactuca virosa TaxID=75947 RepID=A0AAU9LGX3_9ASTR|nr:unnamed protein product [Lactuca virosa]
MDDGCVDDVVPRCETNVGTDTIPTDDNVVRDDDDDNAGVDNGANILPTDFASSAEAAFSSKDYFRAASFFAKFLQFGMLIYPLPLHLRELQTKDDVGEAVRRCMKNIVVVKGPNNTVVIKDLQGRFCFNTGLSELNEARAMPRTKQWW